MDFLAIEPGVADAAPSLSSAFLSSLSLCLATCILSNIYTRYLKVYLHCPRQLTTQTNVFFSHLLSLSLSLSLFVFAIFCAISSSSLSLNGFSFAMLNVSIELYLSVPYYPSHLTSLQYLASLG